MVYIKYVNVSWMDVWMIVINKCKSEECSLGFF